VNLFPSHDQLVAYGVQEGLKRAFRSDTGEAKRRRTSSARPTGTANMSYNPTNSPFLRSKGFQRQLSYAQRKRFLSKNKRTGGFAGQEVKFYDETIGSTSLVSNTWSIQSDISTPAQGSSPTERDGRVAFIRSVHGKLFITVPNGNSSTPPGDVIVRMVLIWDTQTNQAALSMTDVMEPAPNDALEFRNLEYSSRFIVLKDKQLTIRVPFQYEPVPITGALSGARSPLTNPSRSPSRSGSLQLVRTSTLCLITVSSLPSQRSSPLPQLSTTPVQRVYVLLAKATLRLRIKFFPKFQNALASFISLFGKCRSPVVGSFTILHLHKTKTCQEMPLPNELPIQVLLLCQRAGVTPLTTGPWTTFTDLERYILIAPVSMSTTSFNPKLGIQLLHISKDSSTSKIVSDFLRSKDSLVTVPTSSLCVGPRSRLQIIAVNLSRETPMLILGFTKLAVFPFMSPARETTSSRSPSDSMKEVTFGTLPKRTKTSDLLCYETIVPCRRMRRMLRPSEQSLRSLRSTKVTQAPLSHLPPISGPMLTSLNMETPALGSTDMNPIDMKPSSPMSSADTLCLIQLLNDWLIGTP